MEVTFEEITDILDKWEFLLGQRAGRELWADKPTDVQNMDLMQFCQDLETLRRYIGCKPGVTCDKCKHLRVLNEKDIHAFCHKTGIIFEPFALDTREMYCGLGESKE